MTTILKQSIVMATLIGLVAGCPSKSPSTTTVSGNAEPVTNDIASTPTELVFPEESFRQAQPAAEAPRDFNLPAIQQFKLGGMIDVFLVEQHTLPTISMELNFDGGAVVDGNGQEGTARVCMAMMSEGTKALDKLAFEEAQADLAASIGSYAGEESQGVSMRTLTKNFDPTFDLFSATLLQPGFRKEDLSRMIERNIESLKQAKGSAESVAGRVLDSVVYGDKHPFGNIVTEKSLKRIKINDCSKHHNSYLKPMGARLFVVGDMTQAQIEAKFAPLLAKWKGSPKKLGKMPAPTPKKGRVFFIDVPGAAQSSIHVVHLGPNRDDEDFFANQMMVNVLGGGFSSRMNMNLREDKGFSYGARGGFSYNKHNGVFHASSSVKSDTTRESLDEIFGEMGRLKSWAQPATPEELAREKNGAILSLPARFATSSEVLSMYRTLVYFGLPMDYYNSYVENVGGVTLEGVKAAAARLLHPEDAIVLVAGDGSAPQITRDGMANVPRKNGDGSDMTLHQALVDLAASDLGGTGPLVILDADGKITKGK